VSADWTRLVRLHELARGPVTLTLEPDAGQRAKIAYDLGLETLPSLTATVTVKPWLDGAEITGRFEAVVEQLCGLTLDPFEQPLAGEIEVRAVPPGSPHARPEEAGELELDLEAPDPPDLLGEDAVDVAHYVVEHLALAIDPFPRKPGAEFEFTPPAEEESPFAVLKKLKDPKP
jgi:uncharacterized metal-binding protein YceD (DUF177 family)